MAEDAWQDFDPEEDFDVKEVSDASDEADDVVLAGTVRPWEMLEYSEKAKARPYITGIVLSTWSISVIASALRLLFTGNLLLFVPPVLIAAPLYLILRFYYRSG